MQEASIQSITVVDTSVSIYLIEGWLRDAPDSVIEEATRHYLKLMLCGCYFPSTNIVLALDMKVDGGYWRHEYLKDFGINYKAGRKEKRKRWFKIADVFTDTAAALGVPIIGFPGYEADDVAALIAWLHPNVDLFTVDTDWLQLVDTGRNTRWLNSARWAPRLRDNIDAINTWGKLGKLKYPRQIIDIKVEEGDKSDNLPPGSPREVIDLMNPPDEFNLTKKMSAINNAHWSVEAAKRTDFSSLESLDSIQALMGAGLPKGLFWGFFIAQFSGSDRDRVTVINFSKSVTYHPD